MHVSNFYNWSKQRPLIILAGLFLLVDVVLASIYIRHNRGVLTVAFLNVGQGDAVFIEVPNGNQMLYDAGPPSGAVLRALADVMPWYDRSIDVAVFSHPDMDHIGGFLDVFDRYKVDLALEPGARSDNGVWSEAEIAIAKHNISRIIARRGMSIDLGGGVVADILYPDNDMTTVETNAASIVLRIHYGDTAFLLSGDLPIPEENHVVAQDGAHMSAQVLKAGHHGSRTSSGGLWLRAVKPDLVVVSAGKDNRYGHPHKEVLDTLDYLHIPHLETFDEGSIIFESDGMVVTRR